MKYFVPLFCTIFLFVTESYAEKAPYWIFFRDRGDIEAPREIARKIASSEPKNLSRRARVIAPEKLWNETDLPVNPDYISQIEKIAGKVRTVTRYLNGVSVELESDDVPVIKALPFVREVRPVAVSSRPPDPSPKIPTPKVSQDFVYGFSHNQLSMIRVPQLHSRGFLGEGIIIGVLDAGYDGYDTHSAFDSLRIGEMWDFVEGNDMPTGHSHGSEVLSVMAAHANGSLMGAAPRATYLLARTEQVDWERRIEEDFWVSGIEWADSLGADIVTSSLGYYEFDDPLENYTFADLDGETSIATIAADIAVSKGIVVVVSAGNEGNRPWRHVTVPADGKDVLAVGAIDLSRNISPFSSVGPTADDRIKPDFVALGQGVWTVNASTGEGYWQKSGTSFSTPLIAGAVALMLEANTGWTPHDVREALRSTSHDLGEPGPDNIYGWGLIDALAAAGLDEPVDADEFKVYDPYPQPIVFSLEQRRIYFPIDIHEGGKRVILRIFTFNGDLVYRSETQFPSSGSFRDPGYALEWDGMNMSGQRTAPGIYFYSLEIPGLKKHTGKIMVMR